MNEPIFWGIQRSNAKNSVIIWDWTDDWRTLQTAVKQERLYGIVMLDQFADGAAEKLRKYMVTDGIHWSRSEAACPYNRMRNTFNPTVEWLRDAIDEAAFWVAAIETDAITQILCDHSQLDQALELVDSYPEFTYIFYHFAYADPNILIDS